MFTGVEYTSGVKWVIPAKSPASTAMFEFLTAGTGVDPDYIVYATTS
jgi:nitric oxide synthase oxygenase domain/subunit